MMVAISVGGAVGNTKRESGLEQIGVPEYDGAASICGDEHTGVHQVPLYGTDGAASSCRRSR
jgi:hypothetical protein